MMNRSFFPFLILLAFGLMITFSHCISEGILESGDAISHYQLSRYSWKYPLHLLDHWGKPLFTLLSSPFAQLGFNGYLAFGPSPLSVVLSASESWDADGDLLSYHWDFGDGEESSMEVTLHEFVAPDETSHFYEVILTVTDTAGNVDVESQIISLNNTPPLVDIASISEGSLYSTQETSIVDLIAQVTDLEHDTEELDFAWQTIQYHNTHFHANPPDHAQETTTVFEPAGCEDYATYYYKVALTVTDPAGLSGYDERFIHPDCSDTIPNPIPQFSEYVIYPNPNGGDFTLRGTFESEDEVQIGLYGLTGRAILEEKRIVDAYGRLGFSIPGLSPGQYLLRIKDKKSSEVLRLQIMD